MMQTETKKTGGSALMIILLAIVVISVFALAGYVIMHYDLLKNILLAVAVIFAVIVLIVVIIFILMFILAIPFYALKGESYQTGVDYDMDQVESVKESKGDDTGKKE